MARQQSVPTATHEVFNQPPPLVDYNLFASDRALSEAVAARRRRRGRGRLDPASAPCSAAPRPSRRVSPANPNPPVLRAFDRYGNRRDEVEFHPAYHAMLMALAVGAWACIPRPGPSPGPARMSRAPRALTC